MADKARAPATPTAPAAAAPAKRGWAAKAAPTPKAPGGLSGFIQGVGAKASALASDALQAFRTELEKLIGPYPSPAQRPARTAKLDAAVAKMNLPADQQAVLQQLAKSGTSTVDLWQGSHMVFDGDGGKLYDYLKSQSGAEARSSSHYPSVATQQYQLMIGKAPLLFGKDQQGNTWLQMEGHAFHQNLSLNLEKLTDQLGDDILHLRDYRHYLELGKAENIGPMGLSPHSELHDPLHLTYTP